MHGTRKHRGFFFSKMSATVGEKISRRQGLYSGGRRDESSVVACVSSQSETED